MKKQVIFVAGIFTPQKALDNWKEVLKEKFKDSDIITIGKSYSYLDIKKMKKITKKCLSLIKNNKETILIGHSFGAIIINSALNKYKKHNVKQVIIIASPHKINKFGMKKRKAILGYSENATKGIPTNTLGAYFDPVVPFFTSSLKNAKHKNLFTEHFLSILYNKKTIEKILDYSTK
jgi:predicted alpha/beta hydrolase family esterase|tara:strand:+ start:466 stop:996 length:531 start_codon:yes stop_codon:yes gene_type:complete